MTQNNRAFVCDPVCALPFGHNVLGLKYFSDAARPFFKKIFPLTSSFLPIKIRESYGFEAAFDFYYHKQLRLGVPKSGNHTPLTPTGILQDPELAIAISDFAALFQKFSPTENDAIIFPSVDFYGAMGALKAVSKLDPSHSPVFYLRFIGVMENATSTGSAGLPRLLQEIRRLLVAGYKINICAETPLYANHLASELELPVGVVPYPPHSVTLTTNDLDGLSKSRTPRVFTIACPGSSRIDKGYLSLKEIFSAIRRLDPDLTIHFILQSLPIDEALAHSHYTNQLYAIPGVNILPSSLTEAQMNAIYETSQLVILPYDFNIYRYRGSAVFMECLTRGIPVVALEGSAFCDQITYYTAGSVAKNIPDLISDVMFYYEKPRRATLLQMQQARYRYVADADASFAKWMSQ